MKISVLIPTHIGREIYVEKILKSLVNQSFSDFEVIICDNDDSKINIPNFVNHYSKHLNLTYKINENNIGPKKNISKLLSLAKGEYVNIIMSDDLIDKDFLKHTVNILDNNKNVSLVFGKRKLIDEFDKILENPNYFFLENSNSGIVDKKKLLEETISFKWFPGEPSNFLFRNNILDPTTAFDSISGNKDYSYAGSYDLILYIKLLNAGEIYFEKKAISYIREFEGRSIKTLDTGSYCMLDYFYFARDAYILGLIERNEYLKMFYKISEFIYSKLKNKEIKNFKKPFYTAKYISEILLKMEKEINENNTIENLGKMALFILNHELSLNILETLLVSDKQFYCYGTGTFAERFFKKHPALKEKISHFIDSDLKKEGHIFLGKKIIHSDNFCLKENEYILILSSFFKEIESFLTEKGFVQNEQFFSISQMTL